MEDEEWLEDNINGVTWHKPSDDVDPEIQEWLNRK